MTSKEEKNAAVIFKEKRTNQILLSNDKNKTTWKKNIFYWSTSGSFIYRHHVQERQEMYVPRDICFPTPLKYLAVVRRAHTALDVLQECQIDEYWNVDVDLQRTGPWTGSLF